MNTSYCTSFYCFSPMFLSALKALSIKAVCVEFDFEFAADFRTGAGSDQSLTAQMGTVTFNWLPTRLKHSVPSLFVNLCTLVFALAPLSFLCQIVHYRFFHPLKEFPGLFWWGVTRIPLAWSNFWGQEIQRETELAKKYAGPELYGADAEEWKPERWLNAENAALFEKYNFIFGYGSRLCLGHQLGMMSVVKTPLMFVKNFRVSLDEKGGGLRLSVRAYFSYWEDYRLVIVERHLEGVLNFPPRPESCRPGIL
ncbi:hypothetical protein BDZ45DRAFT_746193 [Acephala macrosclerotiorum]|nr:hypothetical protein BDZ45DRAFT_746193 [Acephala macrosclerotiorum]